MKILLVAINAKYIHSNLAVYNLKAYAKELPAEIKIVEATINQQPQDILQQIYEEHADIVAFSCYIWNINMVVTVAEELRKVASCEIWLGGPEASYDAVSLLKKHDFVDLVMVGEGEETFYELVEKRISQEDVNSQQDDADKKNEENCKVNINSKQASTSIEDCKYSEDGNIYIDIKGIVYRDKQGNIHANTLRDYMNLDKIPFVYQNTDVFANKIIYYETSRGCPFSCSYCLSSIDKRVRFRSLNLVFAELAHFLAHKVKQVKFVDRTFNCKHDHAYAIWQYLLEHDNGITNFHFEVSADLLQEEDFILFEKMRPGLIQLEIGVQSTNPDTITAIHRKMELSELAQNVARVKSGHNIHQHLDLIAGLPHEDLETFKKSFNDVYAMQPDQLQLGFLKVLKGSDMYQNRENYEIAYTSQPPYEVLCTKWLSFDNVLELKGIEEMVEVYYNSGQYKSSLDYLLPYFANAYDFYYHLSHYYHEQGYDQCKHTRLARYDIRREFFHSWIKNNEKAETLQEHKGNIQNAFIILDEHLKYDIYLTEHSKRYPSWAVQDTLAKEMMSGIRNARYREEHFTKECLTELEPVIQQKSDIFIEHLPRTKGGYVLFNYGKREPLTNEAECIRIVFLTNTVNIYSNC